ncbi:hypothetical protein RRG08_001429 [Elysia crispata]|uniref:Uncharacterized protein n=1 Tax=Elysia crispata TaxID=231223 RepID=A0AAE1DL09_9GAST|nr:hypothetical protein RRG08_001429 [Elysia crispata]
MHHHSDQNLRHCTPLYSSLPLHHELHLNETRTSNLSQLGTIIKQSLSQATTGPPLIGSGWLHFRVSGFCMRLSVSSPEPAVKRDWAPRPPSWPSLLTDHTPVWTMNMLRRKVSTGQDRPTRLLNRLI